MKWKSVLQVLDDLNTPIRALPSGVLNVPNAKYLAHLTHQAQK